MRILYDYLDGSQGAAGPVKIFNEAERRAVEADLIRRGILKKPDAAKELLRKTPKFGKSKNGRCKTII